MTRESSKSGPENPLAIEEDFEIPAVVRDVRPQSKAEQDEDVAYFLKNLWAAIKLPKELQGADDEPKQQGP
jgi:hypothetical protein